MQKEEVKISGTIGPAAWLEWVTRITWCGGSCLLVTHSTIEGAMKRDFDCDFQERADVSV